MVRPRGIRLLPAVAFIAALSVSPGLLAQTQTDKVPTDKAQTDKAQTDQAPPAKIEAPPPATSPSATPQPAPSTPAIKGPPSATPPTPAPPPPTPGSKEAPPPAAPAPKQPPTVPAPTPAPPGGAPSPAPPEGKPNNTEIERNGSPGIPDNATTESVNVQAHVAAMVGGQASYDDAFKSIKASLDKLTQALDKAGIKPAGHPITIFSEPDDKGFKYKLAIPLAAKPDKPIGDDVTIGDTPAGKAIKFQHRGAYDDIDSTYDVITAYLDAKGLQVDNPYIEEYLTNLTTPDDPNLQVDIYVFVK